MGDIFERLARILPSDVEITNYPIKRPVVLFNPGAILNGKKLMIFPRLVIGYYMYSSSIGYFEIDINDLLENNIEKPIKTRIFLYPKERDEIRGVEDPRIQKFDEEYYILYTAVDLNRYPQLKLLITDERFRPKEKLVIKDIDKDSALIKERNLVLFARLGQKKLVSGILNKENGWVNNIKVIWEVRPGEERVGWSTNAVKIGKDEYLIGWHARMKDLRYMNSFAIVNPEGDLLGISEDFLLYPNGIEEMYGDRPWVIFGCGLVKYKENIIWVGGVSDTYIGIFRTDLDSIMEHIRYF